MPFKHNEPNRDHIPRARYKVTNWAEYERGLVRRGDVRFWFSDDALEGWIAPYRKTPGGQHKFSNVAIEATLILGAAFKRNRPVCTALCVHDLICEHGLN